MTNSSLVKKFIFALSILSVVSIISCDTDYNDIGSDIIDDDVHHNMIKYEAGVTAYDRATGVVQSNNLPLNTLGVYDNPVFGKTVAHFVTQVELGTVNPTLYEPEVDSVYMYIPYYSRLQTTNSTSGVSTYELDSIYGDTTAKFKLHVYENRFFLRDSDPGSSAATGQKYYSNDKGLIEANLGAQLNNFTDVTQNEEFRFTAKEIARTANVNGTNKVVERKAPGIFMYMDVNFFRDKIFSTAANGKLTNNNTFKEYFRGLYFKVEQTGNQAVMGVPKFDQGTITIKYRDYIACTTCPGGVHSETKEEKTMTLNLDGNTINFFENTFNPTFASAIAASSPTEGDSQLYVKGGEGSMAFIDLDPASLDALREENMGQRVLINEANLVFHVDQNTTTGMGQFPAGMKKKEPLRVYLYDVNNKRPLIDYYLDATTIPANAKYDKYVHGGLLEEDANGNKRYKIRITNHINNIINKDSTNVKLGLVVSEYINLTGNAALRSPFTEGSQNVDVIPVSSVIHPFGTVLYGSNPAVPEDKRVKLEIFYTKPN